MSTVIQIAHEFSTTPGGRYRTDGPFSGEEFRDDILLPALKKFKMVTVDLNGTRGYPSSFLDEAFGGLVVKLGMSFEDFCDKVQLVASNGYDIYKEDIISYVKQRTGSN